MHLTLLDIGVSSILQQHFQAAGVFLSLFANGQVYCSHSFTTHQVRACTLWKKQLYRSAKERELLQSDIYCIVTYCLMYWKQGCGVLQHVAVWINYGHHLKNSMVSSKHFGKSKQWMTTITIWSVATPVASVFDKETLTTLNTYNTRHNINKGESYLHLLQSIYAGIIGISKLIVIITISLSSVFNTCFRIRVSPCMTNLHVYRHLIDTWHVKSVALVNTIDSEPCHMTKDIK